MAPAPPGDHLGHGRDRGRLARRAGRGDDPHEWASRDMAWALAFLSALAMAAFVPVFLWLALAMLAVGIGLLVARYAARRRRERANADAPYWVDRIRDS
ncbi:MAG TPA: hypothetical protein VNA20_02020 [Frankiaceae bacterium]|nr:hypothetical protein [Frankiaceae bacterium]